MQKMNYSKAIAAGAFLLCLAAGFGITKVIKSSGSDSPSAPVQTETANAVSPATTDAPSVTKKATQTEEAVTEERQEQTVVPDVLASLEKKEKMKEAEKRREAEKRKEKKTEEKVEEAKEEVVVAPKMSVSEVRSMLRRGDYVGADKLSPNFRIHTSGMRSGERTPESSMDVYDKLRTEQWKDFSVSNVEYDDQGRVTSVTIRPVYQSEERRVAI